MKITLWMAMAVNGIIATNDNKEDFLSQENWTQFVLSVKEYGCLVWGRKTYEMVKTWENEYLESLEGVQKVIISSTTISDLPSDYIVAHSPQETIEILDKKGITKTIVAGGSQTNTAFAKLGYIQEIILNIEGVIVGNGIPLFAQEDFTLSLKLKEIKKINDTLIQLHYLIQ